MARASFPVRETIQLQDLPAGPPQLATHDQSPLETVNDTRSERRRQERPPFWRHGYSRISRNYPRTWYPELRTPANLFRPQDPETVVGYFNRVILPLCATVFIIFIVSGIGISISRTSSASLAPIHSYRHGAIATEIPICSTKGKAILQKGGNAVDATIAAALCIGAVHGFASGLGGGGVMLVRDPNGTMKAIDFLETAPAAANETMFVEDSSKSRFGGLAVAVPGELRGLEMAHEAYGTLEWKELFEPTIGLCESGFIVTETLAEKLRTFESVIRQSTEFRNIFVLPSGELAKKGSIIYRKNLAKTLRVVAKGGAQAFYTGSIAKAIVTEVQSKGGILTLEDMANYEAHKVDPVHGWYHGRKVVAAPPPSSGAVLISMLNFLERYNLGKQGAASVNMHRMVESMKFGFAKRSALGDPKFLDMESRVDEILGKDEASRDRNNASDTHSFPWEHYSPRFGLSRDHGMAHISVVDEFNMCVSLTTTLNFYFGSHLMASDTGVLLNNQMDNFSTPGTGDRYGLEPSPSNFIRPGKRPTSSACPAIIETDQSAGIAIGGSGGAHVLSSVLQTLVNVLDFDLHLRDAVFSPRMHHQLIPDELELENTFPSRYERDLIEKGHRVKRLPLRTYASLVQAVRRRASGVIEGITWPFARTHPATYIIDCISDVGFPQRGNSRWLLSST